MVEHDAMEEPDATDPERFHTVRYVSNLFHREQMTGPGITIVLPTYNRSDVLERTVRAYAAQHQITFLYEIIVVNDGSTDATREILARLEKEFSDVLRVYHKVNAGPGAARNLAIREAGGDLILFAGDDVVPSKDMVAHHLRRHAESASKQVAVLGKITWSDEIEMTPFMYWLENGGPQFAYNAVEGGENLPPTMFYTSNLSVPRKLLLEAGSFDERFTAAGWEDVDLGIRLTAAGMAIVYEPVAVGLHFHAVDFKGYVRRTRRAGYFHAMLIHKHGLKEKKRTLIRESLKAVAGQVLRLTPIQTLRHIGYRWSLSWHEYRGMKTFWSEETHHA